MSDHTCLHESDFGRMAGSIQRIEKEIFGNGHKGLSHTVPVLADNIEQLKKTSEDLRITVSGFKKFMYETEGSRTTWRGMTPWIAVIIAALTLSFSVYQSVRVNKLKEDQMFTEMRLKYKQDKAPDTTVRSLQPTPELQPEIIE